VTTEATRQRRSNPGKPGKRLKLSKGVHLGNRTFNGAVPRCYVLSGGVIFVASIHGNTVRLRRSSRTVKRSNVLPSRAVSGTRLTLLPPCLWRTQAEVGNGQACGCERLVSDTLTFIVAL
jgi:hypothetical protein